MTNTSHQSHAHRLALPLICGLAMCCSQNITMADSDHTPTNKVVGGVYEDPVSGTSVPDGLAETHWFSFNELFRLGSEVCKRRDPVTGSQIPLHVVSGPASCAMVYAIEFWLSN